MDTTLEKIIRTKIRDIDRMLNDDRMHAAPWTLREAVNYETWLFVRLVLNETLELAGLPIEQRPDWM